jgi:hypothetical protein
MMDRLNVRNILKRKKFKLQRNDYTCVLCTEKVEKTTFHLFFSCPFSQQCWHSLKIHWDLSWFLSHDGGGEAKLPSGLLHGNLSARLLAHLEAT